MKMKWIVLSAVGVLLVAGILLMFNQNVRGVVKMTIMNSDMVHLDSSTSSKTVMTYWNDGEGLQQLLVELEKEGWKVEDQIGSAFMFINDEKTLFMNVRKWTDYYVVAEMTEG